MYRLEWKSLSLTSLQLHSIEANTDPFESRISRKNNTATQILLSPARYHWPRTFRARSDKGAVDHSVGADADATSDLMVNIFRRRA
ncbi:Uncharacterized protein HZ326_3680 [Fusarium oxysporum f. sp. albedinis]|nr:Uncharacterized protein HZ326_3680 [Fusarium oxysporum f. sp. albedinis]